MKRALVALSFIVMCVSCSHKIIHDPRNYNEAPNVKLELAVENNHIYDSIQCSLSLANSADQDFYILGGKYFHPELLPGASIWTWEIYVTFEDSISGRQILIIDPIMPGKKDYTFVKAGDTYTRNFAIDFQDLSNRILWSDGQHNPRYGKYTFQLVYRDKWLIHKKALHGFVYSNKIDVFYDE